LPQPRLLPRFKPVAFLPLNFAGCATCHRSPSGMFVPSGSTLDQPRNLSVRLPESPDFRSLPAAFHLSFGCGSSFPIRYVSAGLLFLKPLGTFFTMPSSAFAVNVFLLRYEPFQQLLSGCISNQLR